jgi:LacI family transcriptional regulator/LacI family repressor for deo operon, udp, cdd, tsx, nupC, and nupG
VTCYNDLVAIGVGRALRELGLRIPDDISLVGFDDIPLAEFLDVPLTTVRVPTFRMGELAADMLIKHVESATAVPVQKAYLEAQLVVRRSTRAMENAGAVSAGEGYRSAARSNAVTTSARRGAR